MVYRSVEGLFPRWRSLIGSGIIVLAALGAYHNSFSGPFVFDGQLSIAENPHIRQLWPIWDIFRAEMGATVAGRPVLSLSFALNYQISGLEVWSYHAVNLAVHILAALTLLGIVRRTLLCEKLRARFGQASFSLALICALIWMLHPLQTGSVTYIVQRAESLMGLFYLLSLYCAIRGFSADQGRRWYILAILACALGMGVKEVMVTAPLMVLFYDRIFESRSFKEIFNRRWGLYGGLAATWLIFGVLFFSNPRGSSVGLGFEELSVLEYAMTQCKIIVGSYLKLSFWPHPLIFDYGWPIVRSFGLVVPHTLVLAVLLIGSLTALRYRPAWGFLGVWFFVILGPSSSFVIIITEVAAEHRMYLPLAAVVVAVVLGGYVILARWSISGTQRAGLGRVLGYILAGVVVAIFSLLSFWRNNNYASVFSIWDATVSQCPGNSRAWNNRGTIYSGKKDYDLAIGDFNRALAIEFNPTRSKAYYNRGITYSGKGEYERAIQDFDQAIALNSKYGEAYNMRGNAYARQGQYQRAIQDFSQVIRLSPSLAGAYTNRGVAYKCTGDYNQAIQNFDQALELDPRFISAYHNRGVTYSSKGEHDKAIRDFERAVQLAQADGNERLAEYVQNKLEWYKVKHPHPE